VYQVYSLNPPTAFATNPETSAFIAADGIYTFIALGGGALLGLAGYIFGVRRYGLVPLIGVVLGSLAAAFLARWLGPLLTGQDSFNNLLGSSKPGTFLHAPITLGAQGALAFWPVAAALVAGGLELAAGKRTKPGLHAARGTSFSGPLTGYQPRPDPRPGDGYQQRASDQPGPVFPGEPDDRVPPGTGV
jgi:hypothetical protein